MSTDLRRSTGVLIVGGGPVGLTAAILAHKAGMRATLVERRTEPVGYPAGHVINQRSLEIWRQIDPMLASSILNDSAPIEDVRYIIWCTSLAGEELARIRTIPDTPSALAERFLQSPLRPAHYPQSRLERQLWRWVREHTDVEFLAGHECVDVESDGEGVTARIEGAQGRMLRARFCIAADGAGSGIRRKSNIAMPGPMLMRVASIHFRANLDRLIRGRPAVIYWIYNEHLLGPLIRHSDNEWILMSILHPPQRSEHFDEAHWRELIREALGTRAVDIEVNAISTWAMTAQVAEQFRSGNILLAGDAAHRFPPTGGYGINTGVQDVHNLIWKLRAVVDGMASESLLDSYEIERKPVAEANCARSIANQEEMDAINEAVALRSKDMARAHRMMESRLFRALPEATQLRVAADITRIGLRKIRALERPGKRGLRLRNKLRAAAAEQKAHFGGAHGVDLGYRYSGPLVIQTPVGSDELSTSDLVYKPSTVPGMRVPHAWVERGGERQSTLDLLDYAHWQLWVDDAWAGEWAQVLAQVNSPWPLTLVSLGAGDGADARPVDGRWSKIRGVDASGAILLRPDGHVIWRCSSLPIDAVDALEAVLSVLPFGVSRAKEKHHA